MEKKDVQQITPTHSNNQYKRTISSDSGKMSITSAPDVNGKLAGPPPSQQPVITEADIQAQKKLKDMESFIKQLKMKPPKAGK